jgi:magnesium transporter
LITGIFGMNFKEMPLLEEDYGFWLIMAIMAAVSVSLWVYFRLSRIVGDTK